VAAVLFIIAGAFFDAIDGIVARLVNTSSQFGVELDSISDIVSFGAAPAFLIYKSFLFEFDILGIIISGIFLTCGAFRLARFNVQIEDITEKTDFRGLPIPVAALTLATFVYNFYESEYSREILEIVLISLTAVLSLLMISNVKYDSIPLFNKFGKIGKAVFLLAGVVSSVILFLTEGKALFYVFFSIILFGIFRQISNLFLSKNKRD
jgi:CDP-diacylglycerol--serine O-phosphatidyltransferase